MLLASTRSLACCERRQKKEIWQAPMAAEHPLQADLHSSLQLGPAWSFLTQLSWGRGNKLLPRHFSCPHAGSEDMDHRPAEPFGALRSNKANPGRTAPLPKGAQGLPWTATELRFTLTAAGAMGGAGKGPGQDQLGATEPTQPPHCWQQAQKTKAGQVP